jgi:hypothetical protein
MTLLSLSASPWRRRSSACLFGCAEVPGWCGPQSLLERADEGAGRAVAGFHCGVGYFHALSQQSHGLHQAKLLSPSSERHAQFTLKDPFDGAFAGAAGFTELCQGASVARIFFQHFCDSTRSNIRHVRELQWDHLDYFELIHDHINQVTLPRCAPVKSFRPASLEDEFPEQRGYIHNTTHWPQRFDESRLQIKRAHGHRAGCGDGVSSARGDPNRAVGWHDPDPIVGANRHDPKRRVHELIAVVKVPCDKVAGRIVVGESGDRGMTIGQAIEQSRLSLSRHSLSP